MSNYDIGFSKLGVDLEKVNSKGLTTCPKCSHLRKKQNQKLKVFMINRESGNYYCNHCEIKGRVDSNEWIQNKHEFDNKINQPISTYQKVNKVSKIQHTEPIKPFYRGFLTQNTIDWFKNERGINKSTLDSCNVAENKGVVCFNYYKNNKIVHAKYRKTDQKFFWQHKGTVKYLYGLDDIKGLDEVIFCEGEFDKLAAFQSGHKNCVSVAQGAPNVGSDVGAKLQCLDNSIDYIKDLKRVVLACDNDPNGKYLTSILVERFGANRCAIVEYPEGCKDLNDVLIKYGEQAVSDCITNAKDTPITGVRTVEQSMDKMIDLFHNGVKKGIPCKVIELKDIFSWYKGWWGLWYGIPNSGKSAYIHFKMMLMSIHYGWKWAVFSPEHYPEEDFYSDMVSLLTGRSIEQRFANALNLEEYKVALEFINNHFFFIYPEEDNISNTTTNVLATIRELKISKGIDGFLVDPFNQLVRESSEKIDVYLEKVLAKVDVLCKTLKLCGNIVAHTSKPQKDKDSPDYKRPLPYDVAGGAMWYNKAYTIGCVHRPFNQSDKSDKSVEIDIQKVKSHKRVGTPDCITLEFDPLTGWYKSIDGTCALDNAFNDMLEQKGLEASKLTGAYLPEDLDDDGDPLPF